MLCLQDNGEANRFYECFNIMPKQHMEGAGPLGNMHKGNMQGAGSAGAYGSAALAGLARWNKPRWPLLLGTGELPTERAVDYGIRDMLLKGLG